MSGAGLGAATSSALTTTSKWPLASSETASARSTNSRAEFEARPTGIPAARTAAHQLERARPRRHARHPARPSPARAARRPAPRRAPGSAEHPLELDRRLDLRGADQVALVGLREGRAVALEQLHSARVQACSVSSSSPSLSNTIASNAMASPILPARASLRGHGHRQRHARLVLRRRAVPRPRRRGRARARSWRRRAPRSSTSAARPPGPAPSPCRRPRSCGARVPVVERLAAGRRSASRSTPPSGEVARRGARRRARRSSTTCPPSASPRRSPALVAERRAPTAASMHMRGEPRTMQARPALRRRRVGGEGVPRGAAGVRRRREGVAEERVWLDPGIGFGKTVEHNLELLRRLDEIVAIGRPVVIGTSRKSFLGKLAGGRRRGRAPARHDRDERDGARARRLAYSACTTSRPVADALAVAAATVGP